MGLFFFFPLKHKTKGKKSPTSSWLSGSFNKQWCDEKHMPTGICGTEKGGLLPPREPEGQPALLQGLGTRAAQPTSQLEAVGRQPRRVTCCGPKSRSLLVRLNDRLANISGK